MICGRCLGDIGAGNIFQSKTQALRTVYRKLDYEIRRRCDRRVFVECARLGRKEPLEHDDAGSRKSDAEAARSSRDDE